MSFSIAKSLMSNMQKSYQSKKTCEKLNPIEQKDTSDPPI